ncbi:MAG: hypothetical protein K6L81_01645 [Agarilytica sp.]
MAFPIKLTLTTLSTIILCSQLLACKSDISAEKENSPKTDTVAPTLGDYRTRNIKDEVFYFVLPDRFYNGDPNNDLGSTTEAVSRGGFDPKNIHAYHGGDLAGLTEKLPYIQALGATAIWLTPILRNQAMQGDISGYHGYWIVDFTEIDPHLGSANDLHTLIEKAHALNIKVFFDIITNHTADVIKYKECHGEKGEDILYTGDRCPYKSLAQLDAGDSYTPVIPHEKLAFKKPDWLNDPKYYHNQGDTTFVGENSIYGDFSGLDDLDTDNPEVTERMIKLFQDLITQFKPDGFRIDTVKHVNIAFWERFSPALMAHAKEIGIENFHMFGEVYSADPNILSKFMTQGSLPSVLDFGFQDIIIDSVVKKAPTVHLEKFFDNDKLYHSPPYSAHDLLNFVGNHDMGRFAYFLKQQNPDISEGEALVRIRLAHAMMFFLRGIPVIYYGDEQGFVGTGGDKYAREDMMASQVPHYNAGDLLGTHDTTANNNFDTSHPLFKSFRQYADIYHAHPGLRYGKQRVLYSEKSAGLFIVERESEYGKYIVVFNTSDMDAKTTIDTEKPHYSLISDKEIKLNSDGMLEVRVPALNFEIFKAR